MKLKLNASSFADAATWASKGISPRPPVPVLSGLLVEAAQDQIRLSGFDYETSARATTAAEVLDAGNVLLPGRMLTDILRKLGNRAVELTVDGNRATISSGNSQFVLGTMQVGDYPAMPTLPAKVGTVDGDLFAEAVSAVTSAASRDDTVPILTCVNITTDGNTMTMVATDRYRVAERTINWAPLDDRESYRFLLKAKWLSDAAKTTAGQVDLLADPDGSTVGIRTGNRATTTGQVDGDYPKIGGLFPAHTPINVTANTADLAEAVERVGLVAERNTPVRLTITADGMVLDAGTGEDATGQDAIDCELDGADITTAFNPAYFTEMLKTVHTETVRLGFTAAAKPVLITPDGDDSAKGLIMPVRIPGKD